MHNALTDIKKCYVNIRGQSLNRKIVVIESDDWGSIRTRSTNSRDVLMAQGVDMMGNLFNAYDTLESRNDLAMLFSFLRNFEDSNGNHPIITANTIVANPDFDAIRKDKFNKYYYEPFVTTSQSLYPGDAVVDYWRSEGIRKNRLLWPQLHGREHFNYRWWMEELAHGVDVERLAFEERTLLGLTNHNPPRGPNGYMAALDMESDTKLDDHFRYIREGAELFEDIFGFRSKSFVAPCGIRSDKHDSALMESGVEYHQMGQQTTPLNEGYRVINRFWGQKNEQGQVYWRRNSSFEPYKEFSTKSYQHRVLRDAAIAFRCGKPLVISSHRVNYVGGIESGLPEYTFTLLEQVLKSLLVRYPDIEFMASDELGDSIVAHRKE